MTPEQWAVRELIGAASDLQSYVEHMLDCTAVIEKRGCTCGLVEAVDRARAARVRALAGIETGTAETVKQGSVPKG